MDRLKKRMCLSWLNISSPKGRRSTFSLQSITALKSHCTHCTWISFKPTCTGNSVWATFIIVSRLCVKDSTNSISFSKWRCVSTYTRSHFSKPTYIELCVTNVLFGNKQHIGITLSWCKVLSTDNVVFKSHFQSYRFCTRAHRKFMNLVKTFRGQFTILYYLYVKVWGFTTYKATGAWGST